MNQRKHRASQLADKPRTSPVIPPAALSAAPPGTASATSKHDQALRLLAADRLRHFMTMR